MTQIPATGGRINAPITHRVLGVDTSLRSTGLGGVSATGQQMSTFCRERVRIPPGRPLSDCLAALYAGIEKALDEGAPDALAIEGAFFSRNVRTAMLLGHARGVVIAAAAARAIPVFEYAPRRVKQAAVGYGAASKTQVQEMIRRILNLDALPQEDIADALALAVCHLHQWIRLPAMRPEPI